MSIEASVEFKVEFYDVDAMGVVWHGNYVKYMELGRCALLDKIGYGYNEMKESNYAFPVASLKLKYIKPLMFKQTAIIKAVLSEYENRIKIEYLIYDKESGELVTKGESIQMALNMKTLTTSFQCPECFIKKVEALL
ncbi:MAG: acyl-CoA thioesterase [Spirochaetia bacterium]|nr:acyl-CoA thioesterase [Spirochaetia bacterium]